MPATRTSAFWLPSADDYMPQPSANGLEVHDGNRRLGDFHPEAVLPFSCIHGFSARSLRCMLTSADAIGFAVSRTMFCLRRHFQYPIYFRFTSQLISRRFP